MHASSDERPSGAVDQQAFEKVIRENLSPEGIAAVIAYLQAASFHKPRTDAQRRAILQVEWLADTLVALLGADECNRLFDELCL